VVVGNQVLTHRDPAGAALAISAFCRGAPRGALAGIAWRPVGRPVPTTTTLPEIAAAAVDLARMMDGYDA